MWRIFWLKSLHFSLEFFVGLAAFATAWIFLDSYLMKKQKPLVFKFSGFFLLAIAAVLHAIGVSNNNISLAIFLANLFGLVFILLGYLKEPFQTKPKVKPVLALAPFLWISSLSQVPRAALLNVIVLIPLVSITFIHATRGYQKQLRPLVLGFTFLALAEAFETLHFLDKTSLLWLSNLLTSFGGVFLVEHFFKFLAFIWIVRYVWQYLPYRLNVEVYLAFVSTILAITLIITLTYTTLLLKSIEKEGLSHLGSDVKTLNLLLESLKAKTLSDAKVMAESSQVAQALGKEDQIELEKIAAEHMMSTQADFLTITDLEGRIIVDAADSKKKGQLITKDPTFAKTLEAEAVSTIIAREGLIAPQVLIQSSVPVKIEDEVTAVILTGSLIDNAFVDGIKASTDLETTVFANDVRAATTFLSADAKSRRIGSRETNKKVLDMVSTQGENFVGPITILNQPFYAAYTPLKDSSGKVIGMFSVGMPQIVILESAEEAIQKTYVATALVMIFSLLPAYWLAKTITYQLSSTK